MKNSIAVLLLFYNKVEETKDCIRSFLGSGVPIYVLNNGSDSTSLGELKEVLAVNPLCKYFESATNLGPARGRNLLIEKTSENWLFFVDNDITVEPQKEWLVLFRQILETNPLAEVVRPQLYNVHEAEHAVHPRFSLQEGKIELDYTTPWPANYFPSGAAIVKRNVFETYGLFDSGLFAFEDYEYAIRLARLGQSLHIIDAVTITLVHNHRFQKMASDKKAVRERYSEKKLGQSFSWIQQKHGVVFEHDWTWWSRKQVKEMTADPFIGRLKKKLKKMMGR